MDDSGVSLQRGGIRLQLTMVALAAIVVPMVIGISAVVVILNRSVMLDLEQQVRSRVAEVASVVSAEGVPGVLSEAGEHLTDGARIQILDSQNHVVYSSPASAGAQPLSPVRPRGDEIRVEGAHLLPQLTDESGPLVGAHATPVQGQRMVVLVLMNQTAQQAAVRTAATILFLALIPLLVLAGGLTWWLVGRALAPVERIRRGVEDITAQRLEQRVEVPKSDDEIARLARTMNAMLGRLESSQTAQRRLVADASHELRSPLAGLRAGLQLSGPEVDAETWRELYPLMETEGRRLERLVDDLMTLSKADERGSVPIRSEDVDLDDIAGSEAARLAATTPLQVSHAIAPVRVTGDPLQLGRAVRNLMDNAAHAARTRVAVTVRQDGGEALVRIEDDGPGIPEADRIRVFERFVRLDAERSRASGGSGLGLAIVLEIVQAHRGSVRVTDSQLGGACFEVRLPAQSDAAAPGEAGADWADGMASDSRR